MPQPNDAISNPERLAALRATHLLDTPAEEEFDQLTRIAAKLLEAPIALVSLVEKDRQFFKSCTGTIPEPFRSETPLSHSFCKHAVASGEPLVIDDARRHPLVQDNPAVRDLGVVAYLGIPLITPEKQALGTLCVLDNKPRPWSESQVEHLQSLATAVMSTIMHRMYRAEARQAALSAEADTKSLMDAAGPLAKAVADYLDHRDGEDRGVQSSTPNTRTPAEAALREAVQAFRQRLDAAGRKPEGPQIRAAVEFLEVCEAYLEAAERRAKVSARFRQLQTALAELEQEVKETSLAEKTLRMALRAHTG